jgi:acyl carrier protein
MGTPQTLPTEEVVHALLTFVNTEVMASGRPIGPADLFDGAGVDSLALLRILVFVESTFGVWVPDEDLLEGNVGSIQALGLYVSSRAGQAA